MTVEIVTPATTAELDAVRALVREFVAWHRRTHPARIDLIDRYFNTPEFEAELAGLPGEYAPPRGALFLATNNGEPAGCVAMHELSADTVEMKRMFVHDNHRGAGVGRALAEAIIAAAQAAGYRRMQLETSSDQRDATRLYERNGFRRISAYYTPPDDLLDWLVFLERDL